MTIASNLLSDSESQSVGDMLGTGCVSLATTVAQVYKSRAPKHKKWYEESVAVVCVVNDSNTRCSWIRAYDMESKRLVFEQELYHTIHYECVRPAFHTFTVPECRVGLSFADAVEANAFGAAVEDLLKKQLKRLANLGVDDKSASFVSKSAPKHVTTFLQRAGAQELTEDKESMNYIMNFIDKNGGNDAIVIDNASAISSPASGGELRVSSQAVVNEPTAEEMSSMIPSKKRPQTNGVEISGEQSSEAKRRAIPTNSCPLPEEVFQFYDEYINKTDSQSKSSAESESKADDQSVCCCKSERSCGSRSSSGSTSSSSSSSMSSAKSQKSQSSPKSGPSTSYQKPSDSSSPPKPSSP